MSDPALLGPPGTAPARRVARGGRMAREALEPGREVDVGRAGHLGLQPDQTLADPEVVERLTIREYLAGERRPVELTQDQDAIRRGHSLSLCASVGRTYVDAMLPGQGPANW